MWLVATALGSRDLEAEISDPRRSKQLSARGRHKPLGDISKGEAGYAGEEEEMTTSDVAGSGKESLSVSPSPWVGCGDGR